MSTLPLTMPIWKSALRLGHDPAGQGWRFALALRRSQRFMRSNRQRPFASLVARLALVCVVGALPFTLHAQNRVLELDGQTKAVEATPPQATAPVPWSRLVIKLTGTTVSGTTVRAYTNGVEVANGGLAEGGIADTFFKTPSFSLGECRLTVSGVIPFVDLEATGTNGLGGWRLGVALKPGEEQIIEWPLTAASDIGGKLLALDGKTPLNQVVVELVTPEDNTGVPSSDSAVHSPQSELDQSLVTSAATNRVLSLPSPGSFVELPGEMFGDLEAGTVEAWVNWQSFRNSSHVFEFGYDHGMLVGHRGATGDLLFTIRHEGGEGEVIDASRVQERQWHHLAAVAGPAGLKLFLDGVLVCEGASPGRFSKVAGSGRNLLGACAYRENPGAPEDFNGFMAEVRVWKVARTAEQIRETMFMKLRGNEPDLFSLWNFDDGTARDASSGGHHGSLKGEATVINAPRPTVMVTGKIIDPAGKPVARASIEARAGGGDIHRYVANAAGDYAVPMDPRERCDFFVTNGELSAYRFGFQPSAEPQQRLDWTLADPEKTPVVLGSSRRGNEADTTSNAYLVYYKIELG